MKPKTKRIVMISLIVVLLIASVVAVNAFLANQREAGATYQDPEVLGEETIRRWSN